MSVWTTFWEDESLVADMHRALGQWLAVREAGAVEPGQSDSGSVTLGP